MTINIWLFRALLAVILLLIFLLCARNPLFTEIDLSEHNGEKIALYFAEIREKRDINTYIAEVRGAKVKVVCNGSFKEGDIVSFHGIVHNSTLNSEKHHIHNYPDLAIHLSIPAVFVFLIVFFRAWEFDLKNRIFVERGMK